MPVSLPINSMSSSLPQLNTADVELQRPIPISNFSNVLRTSAPVSLQSVVPFERVVAATIADILMLQLNDASSSLASPSSSMTVSTSDNVSEGNGTHSSPRHPLSSPSPSPPPQTNTINVDASQIAPFETVPFSPSSFVKGYANANHETSQMLNNLEELVLNNLSPSFCSALLVERLSTADAFAYFVACWQRATKKFPTDHQSPVLLFIQDLLSHHCALLFTLDASITGVPGFKQLITWISAHIDVPLSAYIPFLSSTFSKLPSQTLAAVSSSIFNELISLQKGVTFVDGAFAVPLQILAALVNIPQMIEQFVLMPNFIYPWLNGFRIETSSPMGQFLRLTTLPDEPAVGDRYFTNPLHITDVERLFCMNRLNHKLEKAHILLCETWLALLNTSNFTRAALLTWIATMLTGNWHRTRMRPPRKAVSNDGFLLNITSVMLRVADSLHLFNNDTIKLIDPLYTLLTSRLDVKDETKIAATSGEENMWLTEFNAHAKALVSGTSMDVDQEGRDHTNISSVARSTPFSPSPEALPPLEQPNLPNHTQTPFQSSSYSVSSILPSSSSSSVLVDRPSKFKRARLTLTELRSSSPHNAFTPNDTDNVYPITQEMVDKTSKSSVNSNSTPNALYYAMDTSPTLPSTSPSSHSSPPPISSLLHVGTPEFSSFHDRIYLAASTLPSHPGIICNKCHGRDISGTRYKCVNCKNFDLCSSCELTEFTETLDVLFESSNEPTGCVQCPYSQCSNARFPERDLASHIQDVHANDSQIVICPICTLNGNPGNFFLQQNLLQHLAKEHDNPHDPATHVLLKISRVVPLFHHSQFAPSPLFPLDSIESTVNQFKSQTPLLSKSILHLQNMIEHRNVTCSFCLCNPIMGVAFRCYNCPNYHLCWKCEALGFKHHQHDPSHLFLKFRRPVNWSNNNSVDSSSYMTSFSPNPLLYPAGMLGSCGFNIHTEWMFLLLHTLHVGMLKTCTRYNVLAQSIESEGDPRKLEKYMKLKLCVDAQLLHPHLLTNTLQFYIFVTRWLLSLFGGLSHKQLPLAPPIPMEFAALPEYIIEDIADFIIFLSRFSSSTLETADSTHLVHLFTTLLSSTACMNNPYLRAKLVEVFCGVSEYQHGQNSHNRSSSPANNPSAIAQLLATDRFTVSYLMPALIRLYIDIEHTGSDSQFFDKFNVRHAIAVLIKYLCDRPNSFHTAMLDREAGNVDLFIQFTNSIINDMIYLLDEAFIKAAALRELQPSSSRPHLPFHGRRQEQERLQSTARSLRTAAVLATHTLNLLSILCNRSACAAILLKPEMVDRLAQSINTYVVHLAGTKRESILVRDAPSMAYSPDSWLNILTDMYLCFKDTPEFLNSVVKDGRSFIPGDFRAAVAILEQEKLKNRDACTELNKLIGTMEKLAADLQSEMEDLGDVPEEFLDPILNTLMEDPVYLPSGVTMDRVVIKRHLLNNKSDPFNRQALDVSDLRDATDLRERIEKWKSEALEKRTVVKLDNTNIPSNSQDMKEENPTVMKLEIISMPSSGQDMKDDVPCTREQ